MVLQQELGLRQGFRSLHHEALLNIYYTVSRIKKKAATFFRDYGLTDVQFNLMMLLLHQAGEDGGLTQVELSRMLLVNRANITTLIDRMEKADLVGRTAVPGDRRYNAVRLTAHGKKLLLDVEDAYRGEIGKVMSALSESEQKALIRLLERLRENLAIGGTL